MGSCSVGKCPFIKSWNNVVKGPLALFGSLLLVALLSQGTWIKANLTTSSSLLRVPVTHYSSCPDTLWHSLELNCRLMSYPLSNTPLHGGPISKKHDKSSGTEEQSWKWKMEEIADIVQLFWWKKVRCLFPKLEENSYFCFGSLA